MTNDEATLIGSLRHALAEEPYETPEDRDYRKCRQLAARLQSVLDDRDAATILAKLAVRHGRTADAERIAESVRDYEGPRLGFLSACCAAMELSVPLGGTNRGDSYYLLLGGVIGIRRAGRWDDAIEPPELDGVATLAAARRALARRGIYLGRTWVNH